MFIPFFPVPYASGSMVSSPDFGFRPVLSLKRSAFATHGRFARVALLVPLSKERPRKDRALIGNNTGVGQHGADYVIATDLLQLGRELAWAGIELGDFFHATEDKQAVREAVFSGLVKRDFTIQAMIFAHGAYEQSQCHHRYPDEDGEGERNRRIGEVAVDHRAGRVDRIEERVESGKCLVDRRPEVRTARHSDADQDQKNRQRKRAPRIDLKTKEQRVDEQDDSLEQQRDRGP
jgi:hypothetical protein